MANTNTSALLRRLIAAVATGAGILAITAFAPADKPPRSSASRIEPVSDGATTAASQASTPAVAANGHRAQGTPFSRDALHKMAREMAARPYEPPAEVSTTSLAGSYDAYRKIRFRPESALWRSAAVDFELHALPLGWLYKRPIELSVVENGVAHPVTFTPADFIDQRSAPLDVASPEPVPLSGFRINGPLNDSTRSDEIIVFQGASYLRALGRGHVYGLSARGLAIGTASIKGEEFPEFRKFWIERPRQGGETITIHALLDSPSTTGVYTFAVTPGEETITDVDATIYPRSDMAEVGLAPLTSMNLLSPVNPVRVRDFRPRVHDSDGLAIVNGNGERIWRPLANPNTLQVSVFVDDNPKGFGLMQRHRAFEDYQDLEARYERRPSVWIEPLEPLGKGSVMLVEIPTEEEIHDNIVAFWRPTATLRAGEAYRLVYRMRWRDHAPQRDRGPWVVASRAGRAHHVDGDALRFVVDFKDERRFAGTTLPAAEARSSKGEIRDLVVQENPETGGLRATFVFYPGDADTADLRLGLSPWEADRVPETWIYRWTRSP